MRSGAHRCGESPEPDRAVASRPPPARRGSRRARCRASFEETLGPGACRARSGANPEPVRIPARWCPAEGLLSARATFDGNHGNAGHGRGHSTRRRKRAATLVIRGLELIASGPFTRATLTNFVFMSSLSCYILLPLYVH